MKNIYKVLGLGLLALLLVVGVGAGSANAALTLADLAITSDGALTITGSTTGIITLGSSSDAQTLNLGTGAGVSTVNIATGDAANVITIGSKSVASSALSLTKVLGALKVDGRVTGGGGTTNDYGLQIRTESAKTSGTHWGLDNESHLKASGTTSVRGVQGVSVLDSTFTSTGGSLTGVYGQARADGTFNAPAGFLTGVYGLIEASPAITADHVSSAWLDSHQNNAVTGQHELLYMTNNGTSTMGQAMYIYGGNHIDNLVNLDTVGGMVASTGTAATGTPIKIQIKVNGVNYYLNAYPTSNN